jgi:hypothetical protein
VHVHFWDFEHDPKTNLLILHMFAKTSSQLVFAKSGLPQMCSEQSVFIVDSASVIMFEMQLDYLLQDWPCNCIGLFCICLLFYSYSITGWMQIREMEGDEKGREERRETFGQTRSETRTARDFWADALISIERA